MSKRERLVNCVGMGPRRLLLERSRRRRRWREENSCGNSPEKSFPER